MLIVNKKMGQLVLKDRHKSYVTQLKDFILDSLLFTMQKFKF